MPNLYARSTALPNVVGRVDYISSPNRQERLLGSYDAAAELLGGLFWEILAKESQAAYEQFSAKERDGDALKCCQGREMVIQLANELLQRLTPEEICKIIADEFMEKEGLICTVGLHLKHDTDKSDNLHAHVVFPERQLLDKPVIKTAQRNLFFDAEGRRCYKKSDILDADGQLLPGCSIVKKGEVYEQRYFGSVDAKFSSKAWLKHLKTDVILPLRNGKLKGDVEITEYDKSTGKLAQQHVGNFATNSPNGAELAARIEEYNKLVREYNAHVDAGRISHENAMKVQGIVEASLKKNQDLEECIRLLMEIRRKALEEMKERRRREAAAQQAAQETRQQNNDLDSLIGNADPEYPEIGHQQRRIKVKHDWKTQAMVDTIRVAREVGATNVADMERARKQRGIEFGKAKQAFAAAKEQFERGEIGQDQLDLIEKEYLQTKDQYREIAKVMDELARDQARQRRCDQPAKKKIVPTDPDDR